MFEEDVVPDQRLVHALEVFVADSSDRVRSFGALYEQGVRLYSTVNPSLALTYEKLEFAILVQLVLCQVRAELERDILDLRGSS